jgi:segregation and condensation protein B
MQSIKNKIEAVLFMTGRFLKIEEIAEYCGIGSIGSVKEAMKGLIEDHKKRESGLAIFEEDKKYKLNIKREYHQLSTKLVSSTELDAPSQATLAIIAYKQPARQSDIVKMRGNSAYDHIKTLKEQEFITSEKSGRTRILRLGQKFFDYFDVVEQEKLKANFKQIADKQEKLLEDNIKDEAKKQILDKISKDEKIEIDEPVEKSDVKVEIEIQEEKKEEKKKKDLSNLDPNDFGS